MRLISTVFPSIRYHLTQHKQRYLFTILTFGGRLRRNFNLWNALKNLLTTIKPLFTKQGNWMVFSLLCTSVGCCLWATSHNNISLWSAYRAAYSCAILITCSAFYSSIDHNISGLVLSTLIWTSARRGRIPVWTSPGVCVVPLSSWPSLYFGGSLKLVQITSIFYIQSLGSNFSLISINFMALKISRFSLSTAPFSREYHARVGGCWALRKSIMSRRSSLLKWWPWLETQFLEWYRFSTSRSVLVLHARIETCTQPCTSTEVMF